MMCKITAIPYNRICLMTTFKTTLSRAMKLSNSFCLQRPGILPGVFCQMKQLHCTSCKYSTHKTNSKTKISPLDEQTNRILDECKSLDPVKHSTRLRQLKPIIAIINNIEKIKLDMKSLDDLDSEKLDDSEMGKLLEEEMTSYKNQIKQLEDELVNILLKLEDQFEDCSEVMMEISAGVGGQEAMLFAQEIYNMYKGYALYKKWDCDTPDYTSTDIGGIRQATLNISGSDCFSILKYEGGIHRVQRIPKTEKSGRIHTSTVSVAVLPQPKDIEVNIDSKDLKFETKKASGPGGQGVNTTDSAVRLTHIPTGTVVECQEERSQIKNKNKALLKLKILIYEAQFEKQESECKIKRKVQIGQKNRNEKIRTYNFPQDRITDHRIQKSVFNIDEFMNGSSQLDELINQIREYDYDHRVNQLLS